MYTFLSILIIVLALLLIAIVTIQESKGGGLAAGFASNNQIMGVRKTTDFLEKATWTLAGLLVFFSIIAARYAPTTQSTREVSDIEEMVEKAPMPTPAEATPFSATPEETATPATETTTPGDTAVQ
ncbi:preprotein translocase subunit SecG [Porphyromonas sp. COT-108 OH1349]|uniref:preprotein translocase subunit SecG n=1 Tax=Porphyromonas sp. COT-108 OH1349 TaxID=1537504 RepID=UPI00052B9657|nr:preprotein translocase subunit SecG [Porphyromonas sp. COT-108 OH1349]KGN69482.1 hypothetical protein JT26_04485 [Porphyromonas sp. COT-108 OH1349]